MNRFALVLILSAAMGFSAWATPAAAFDTNSESAINPDGSSRFADPDDQPMPGLSQVAPDVQAYQGVTINRRLINRGGFSQLRRSGDGACS